MVLVRFEVELNGRVLCVAGMDQFGTLTITVESSHWPNRAEGIPTRDEGDENKDYIFVSGYSATDTVQQWANERIGPGDEIRIRVLPPGACESPPAVPFFRQETE